MKKIQFSTVINAPREKVWHALLDDAPYREWTKVFNPSGSYYEGEWKEGSDMNFYGPEEDGSVSGMVAKIRTVRPNEFVSIEHMGMVTKGQKKMWTEEERGTGFFENYTLNEKDGGTELIIDLNVEDEFEDMFKDMWPKALKTLKEIAER